jgi:Tol biopolymer transport system component
VPASGGETSEVSKLAQEVSAHRFPQFLPDGRHLLYFVEGAPDVLGIYIGAINSTESKRVISNQTAGAFMSPDWLLFIRQGTLLAQHLDVEHGELRGDPITVAPAVAFDGVTRAAAFSISASGILAYRASGAARRQLTWFDRTGRPQGTLGPADDTNMSAPSLSPDGRRAAVFRTIQDNTDVWIFDATRVTRLTTDSARHLYPIWSRDGRRIVFDANRNGRRDLYWRLWDDPGSEELLLETDQGKGANDFSPDGRYLLYVTPNDPKSGADLWVLPLQGERKPAVFLQTKFNERQAQFSPDGHWVAYQSDASGIYEIYAREFPGSGGERQISTSGGIQPRWSRDGKEIYYISPEGRLMAVPVTIKRESLEPGSPEGLFQTRLWGGGTNSTNNQQYDVAPDGLFLMDVSTGEGASSPITLLLNWKPPAK